MFKVTEYSADLVKDPFGILTGKRYEFVLDLDVPEEDELHSDKGVYIKLIYIVDENREGILKYELHERTSDLILDFEMEEDEEEAIAAFCKEHLPA
ncbi:DUF6509 family protein [Paenibacillus sepulcri]|uniref:Pullulanase n=1 Tax=Paenibacillus sepulcri TaxID=359917 RepID=A0ABS7CA76_9BACL|nr:pullulanase [Paenibacillus sepulcri]